MKVFVAGGTGVLGRASLQPLIAAGHSVRSTARGSDHAALVTKLGAEPVAVDLFDATAIRKAIAGSEAVLRLTTKIPNLMDMRKRHAWDENNRLRTEGTRILVDAAIAEGVPIYINESVTFVYGDGGEQWLDETAPVDDGGSEILGATLEGEQEAARFAKAGGRGIVLRFGGFYAADAASTRDTLDMVRHRKLAQMGPASNYFASVYVPDAGRAVAAALEVPAGIYNVVDDEPVRFVEYIQALVHAAGAPAPFHLPGFVGRLSFGEVWNYFTRSQRVSNAKLKRSSSWKPAMPSVREGWAAVVSDLDKKSVPDYAAAR
jgi:nucleoside-diphosphate-sugar epimerase